MRVLGQVASDLEQKVISPIDGCLIGAAEEGDYFACSIASLSEDRCSMPKVIKSRSYLNDRFACMFEEETVLCRVRRMAVATGMNLHACVAASLLCDITLTLKCNDLLDWSRV